MIKHIGTIFWWLKPVITCLEQFTILRVKGAVDGIAQGVSDPFDAQDQ